jgi:hypothetical protein
MIDGAVKENALIMPLRGRDILGKLDDPIRFFSLKRLLNLNLKEEKRHWFFLSHKVWFTLLVDPSSPPGGPGGWTSSGSRSPPVLVLLLVPFFALLSSFFAL